MGVCKNLRRVGVKSRDPSSHPEPLNQHLQAEELPLRRVSQVVWGGCLAPVGAQVWGTSVLLQTLLTVPCRHPD